MKVEFKKWNTEIISCIEMVSAKKDSTRHYFLLYYLVLFACRTSDTLEASNIWDRPGVFYILCGDIMWRKNRKHSYITRSNHCMQIRVYTRTLLPLRFVILLFEQEGLSYRFYYILGHVIFDTRRRIKSANFA